MADGDREGAVAILGASTQAADIDAPSISVVVRVAGWPSLSLPDRQPLP